MSNIDQKDMTGRPRNTEDIKDALVAIEKEMVTCRLMKMPELFIHFPTIREGLKELLMRRGIDE